MKNNFSFVFSFFLVIADFIAVLLAFVIAYILRVSVNITDHPITNQISSLEFFRLFLFLIPFWLLIFGLLGLYNSDVYSKRLREYALLFVGSVFGILCVIAYDFFSNRSIFPGKLVPIFALGLGYFLLLIERNVMLLVRRTLFRFGIGVNRIMIIGNSEVTTKLVEHLSSTRLTGYKIVAIASRATHDYGNIRHFTSIETALDSLQKLQVHAIIQTELYESESLNRKIQQTAFVHHVAYKFVPGNTTLYTSNNRIELIQSFPVVSVHETALFGWGRIVKRLFDITVGLIAVVVLSPLMLLTAILIKLTDPHGPVLFKQRRLTRFDTNFFVYKFRTLKMEFNGKDEIETFRSMGREDLVKEFQENRGKVRNDPRITSAGRFLRSTSLDELPQLFNVIKGDISLVGPRAVVEKHAEEYKENRPLMLSVKTGITGLAQVSGRDDITLEERVKLDIFYVQNWSFWLDITILLRTFWVLINRRGFRS